MKTQVSPRRPKVYKWKLFLDALIQDGNGCLQSFNPEVDNGCTITCIHPQLVKKFGLKRYKLPDPILVVNADGTDTKGGESSSLAKIFMKVGKHVELIEALVLDIGHNDMLLGLDWLAVHNPSVDWKRGTLDFIRCPKFCQHARREYVKGQMEKEDKKPPTDNNGLTKGLIPEYVMKRFNHLFEPRNFDKLPKRREWDTFLKEEQKSGKIRPSKSPYAAPCFFIKKKDGSCRLVQDYRKINQYTVKDKFPLPRIDDLIDVLHEGNFFTKMDILWGYNNVRIRKGDEHKAAFLTLRGLFEPTVMYFGLCNSPGTFSRMMAALFRDMITQKKCVVYMDDIVFIGKTLKELEKVTLEGLKILDKAELYIKEPKCYWEVKEVPILGHIVGHGTTRMEP